MSRSLEDILNGQDQRLEESKVATVLLQNKETVSSDLLAMWDDILAIKKSLGSMSDDFQMIESKNEEIKRASKLLDKINEKIIHMEANIPSQLLQDYAKLQTNGGASTTSMASGTCPRESSEYSDNVCVEHDEEQKNGMQDCKKILFKEQEKYPQIKQLGESEFKNLPKYLIGRQNLETVNNFVVSINDVLRSKYGVITLGKVGARKKGLLDAYLAYKKQEFALCKERGNLHCFTAADYEQETKSKLDKAKLNLLTVLRHCKRLREVRTGSAIHYAILTLPE